MKTKILFWWDILREKLWFIPSVFCGAAFCLSIAMLLIDGSLQSSSDVSLEFLHTTGASGRIVLGAMISALVTVVGLVFSIVMLSVAQMSSQFGPRLVRSLHDSNVTQYSLGMLLGTIFYCMVVLSSIRDLNSDGTLFTPHLSIVVAELLGAASLFTLLHFTNHMLRCMRAETLIQDIYFDLMQSAKNIFPELEETSGEQTKLSSVQRWEEIEHGVPLKCKRYGYIQAIDLLRLVDLAAEDGLRIQLVKRVGDFVHVDTVFGQAGNRSIDDDEVDKLSEKYSDCFLLGPVRTLRQDIEAGVLELVEAAIRALSPGVNDPMTAINVIDYMTSFLRHIAIRRWPQSVLLDSKEEPRVYAAPRSFGSILNSGFDQIREYASDSVAVHCRLMEALASVAEIVRSDVDRQAIARQAGLIYRHAEHCINEKFDLEDIRSRAEKVERLLGGGV